MGGFNDIPCSGTPVIAGIRFWNVNLPIITNTKDGKIDGKNNITEKNLLNKTFFQTVYAKNIHETSVSGLITKYIVKEFLIR